MNTFNQHSSGCAQPGDRAPACTPHTPCDRGAVRPSLQLHALSFYMRGLQSCSRRNLSMASPKRLYRVSCLIDASYHWELMELLEKSRAMNVESMIVRHGGEDENGQLKSAPTSREFLTAYAASRPQFTVKEAKAEAERLGVKKDSVGAMIYLMKDEGTLKTLGPATYGLRVGNESRPKAKRAAPIKKKARGGPGETIHEKVVSIVRSKQNGTGEGVATMEIKKALGAAGFSIAGTSPAITTAIKKKLLKRVSGGMYRTVEA